MMVNSATRLAYSQNIIRSGARVHMSWFTAEKAWGKAESREATVDEERSRWAVIEEMLT